MSLFNVTADGLITVDSSEIKASFEDAYKQALGANLNVEAGTPQGQLIITDTKLLTYAQEQGVNIANAFSILTASGKALDVTAGFWGYYRKSAQKTVVRCVVDGTAGTVIPAGSLISDGKNQFRSLDKIVLSSGATYAQFQAVESGAIACEANTLTNIITVINGWDSVNNPTAGILGYDEESDNQFRQRITANLLNIRARGELGSIMDNIAQLDGVLSVIVRENATNEKITIEDQDLIAHSILVSVVGGDNTELAKTIYEQKAAGIGTNGQVKVSYQDPKSGITFVYKVVRPEFVNLQIQVNYSQNLFTPADVVDKIKASVVDYVTKNPFIIGELISGYTLSRALDGFKYANFISLKVKITGDNWLDSVKTTISQIAVLTAENITVTEINE